MFPAFPGVSWQWHSLIGDPVFPSVFPAFSGVTWLWYSIIGVPSVSLSVPSIFVAFLLYSLQGQTCLLFPRVGSLALQPGGQRVPVAVCAHIPMCIACVCLRAFGGCCFLCVFASPPSLPSFFSFVFVCLLFH